MHVSSTNLNRGQPMSSPPALTSTPCWKTSVPKSGGGDIGFIPTASVCPPPGRVARLLHTTMRTDGARKRRPHRAT